MAAVHTGVMVQRRALARPVLAAAAIVTACLALNAAQTKIKTGDPAPGPQRIISIVPATTEMLFDMGAGDRVAGVSAYDEHPPAVERLPKVGGLLDPHVERILSLKPDLVIVYDTQAELKEQLTRAGIPFFNYSHRGLPDITATIRQLAVRIGMAERGEAAARRLESRLDAVRTRVAGRTRPRTLLVIGREPGSLRGISASAGYGFLHDVLTLAGGDDVLADIRRQSADVSTETILARAPDVILELQYGAALAPERVASEQRLWNALASVPAVRSRRVHILVGDEFVVPGPRIASAAERFAGLLHP